jgi:diguanylate cyclase (GGDEF)-like protein/PAS domain S-box-containing protein
LGNQNKKSENKNFTSLLRDAAEAKLSYSLRNTIPGLEDKSIDEIIHEIEVHRIELEMQNSEMKTTLLALEEARDKYINLYNFAPVGYLTISKTGVVLEANLTAADMLGVDPKELVKHGFALYLSERNLIVWEHFLINIFYDYNENICELELSKPDGSSFYALLTCTQLKGSSKTNSALVAISNIDNLKQSEKKLKKSEEKYRSLFENSIDGIYLSTLEGGYIDVNNALVDLLGYDSKEELMDVDIPNKLYASIQDRPEPGERDRTFGASLRKKDGAIIDVEISSNVIEENSKPKYYQGIVRDITDRKKTEKKLRHLSFHDSLTGLYNRAYFQEELERLDNKRQLPLSYIIGDINGLKLVNDALGHHAGDELLITVANLLKEFFRAEDVVARWGGDEFSVILPKTPISTVEQIIERVKKACSKKYSIKNLPISVSFGIFTRLDETLSVETALKLAETNMYKNKLLEKRSSSSSVISAIETMMYEKSYETEEHSRRLVTLSKRLGKSIELPESLLNDLAVLAALHDIGKIAIPEEILLKKDKLTEKEWDIVKRHSEIGYNIARTSPQLVPIAEDILCHHEWWNGNGYPQGLKGEEIPILSRIVSITDSYDVMTNGRPYAAALSKDAAIEELNNGAGTQFDPGFVKIFKIIIEEDY